MVGDANLEESERCETQHIYRKSNLQTKGKGKKKNGKRRGEKRCERGRQRRGGRQESGERQVRGERQRSQCSRDRSI